MPPKNDNHSVSVNVTPKKVCKKLLKDHVIINKDVDIHKIKFFNPTISLIYQQQKDLDKQILKMSAYQEEKKSSNPKQKMSTCLYQKY